MAKRRRQPRDEFWDEPKEPGYSGGGFAEYLGCVPWIVIGIIVLALLIILLDSTK